MRSLTLLYRSYGTELDKKKYEWFVRKDRTSAYTGNLLGSVKTAMPKDKLIVHTCSLLPLSGLFNKYQNLQYNKKISSTALFKSCNFTKRKAFTLSHRV